MTDLSILKGQLRICAFCALASPNGKTYLNEAARPMLQEAADTIERLQAEIRDLLAAYIADVNPNDRNETAIEHARRNIQ